MGLTNISNAVSLLLEHWHNQNIFPEENFNAKLYDGSLRKLFAFEDFMYFYSKANGMANRYPDEYDREGFLFYPAGGISSYKHNTSNEMSEILIIGDYLHKCWWYGVKILDDKSYEILLVEDKEMYTFITNSITDFLIMYIDDSEEIYPKKIV